LFARLIIARTYAYASSLPSFILDALLELPHILISIRNALLPIQPHVLPPPITASTRHSHPSRRLITAAPDSEVSLSDGEGETPSVQRDEPVISDIETGSEADIESGAENDSGAEHGVDQNMETSWVKLNA
jgi:hypothetical protein